VPNDEIIRKARIAEPGPDLDFILSDETVDRYGDVVSADGWDPASLKRHIPALYQHDSGFIVGKWINLRVERGELLGRYMPAKKGTSARIDEVISLAEQKLLPGVSVGFINRDSEPLNSPREKSGRRFKRQELVEASFVGVPANPNAVQIARSMKISEETIRMCFGEPATTGTRGQTGEPASIQQRGSGTTGMSNLMSARIEAVQTRLNGLKDQLQAHESACGDVMTETEINTLDDLNNRIETERRQLESLQRTERNMAMQAAETLPQVSAGVYGRNGGGGNGASTTARSFALPAVQVAPGERFLRSLIAMTLSRGSVQEGFKPPEQIYAERWGDDGKIDEHSRIVLNHVVRAASIPADTTTSGWASQLVQTDVRGFLELLQPQSVYPGLSGRGQRLNFGTAGQITIPTWATTPTIAGSFVGEGAPIPVRQGALTSVSLGPKKMAVITVFTREIMTYSNPTIESLVRRKIQDDTSRAVDNVLLDATAATTIRPAGLRAGVAPITATAGGGFDALVGDLKALLGALTVSSNGNVRSPTWIMNPVQALSMRYLQNDSGDFPFAAEIQAGRFAGYPVIESSTVTAGMVILVDAADFVSVEGDSPMYTVSQEATLHMEDTTPLPINAGTPAVPVRSLYQTDSLALRMIMPLNWAMLRTGMVAWTEAVTW
jgi:HK97 family phage major capsid protein/HK97 family phage prohead protease